MSTFISRFRRSALVLALLAAACEDDAGTPVDAGAPVDVARDGAAPASPDTPAAADTAAGDAARDAGADGPDAASACPMAPAELECDPPQTEALPPLGTRVRQCGFDIGSTNVKLVTTSTLGTDRNSIEGERVCKKAMRLRDRVQDAMMVPKALSEADMDALVSQLKTYGDVCTGDGGKVVGAVATQWARTATNPDQIKTWFMAKLGFPLEIITGDQEGAYGYAAATHGQRDRIILDAGGGSFQVTYWPTDDIKPTAVSLRFGHDESSAKVWTKSEFTDYGAARQAYVAELNKVIDATPASAQGLIRLKELVASAKLGGELISLGDSGVILAVEGKLQDAQGRWVDQNTYLQRLDERRRELATAPVMGPRKTLKAEDLEAFLSKLAVNKQWFEDLRGECIRLAYGGKVLGHLTLVSHLIKEYRLGARVVFTSGEMGEGFILEKLR